MIYVNQIHSIVINSRPLNGDKTLTTFDIGSVLIEVGTKLI